MFPRTIKNVNTWYFHTKTSTPIDCLSTYFYRSLVRKTVCFGLYIDKTCVPDVFSESPLNTDTQIIWTLWHVPLVSVLTGFHCKKKVRVIGSSSYREQNYIEKDLEGSSYRESTVLDSWFFVSGTWSRDSNVSGFRIPWAEFRITKPHFLIWGQKKIIKSILLHMSFGKHCKFWLPGV